MLGFYSQRGHLGTASVTFLKGYNDSVMNWGETVLDTRHTTEDRMVKNGNLVPEKAMGDKVAAFLL